jgi:replication factor A1
VLFSKTQTLQFYALLLTSYRSIFQNGQVDEPILQCVQIKTMEPKAGEAGAVQRFRVVLSDIRNFIQTMVATSTSSVG